MKSVVEVEIGTLFVIGVVLHVNTTRHHQPVNMFQAPAVRDQFTGKPIQQLRMCGTLASHAEIIGRSDETLSEMMLP